MIFCGIDIGTTNTKGILLDRFGKIIAKGGLANPEDPNRVYWFDQFCHVLDIFKEHYSPSQQMYCSVASQGGSFLVLDKNLNPVSRQFLWSENTGQETADDYVSQHSGEAFYKETGWPARGWMPVFKLKQMNIDPSHRIALVPDFIYSRLQGELVTDITNAQMTGLADFQGACWDDELLLFANIRRSQLPELITCNKILYRNIDTRWGRLNLTTSSHDQYMAMHALGLRTDRDIMLGTGTAWVLNSRSREALYDHKGRLHPGRGFIDNQFGNIAGLGMLGRGFDRLLSRLALDYNHLEALLKHTKALPPPVEPIRVDIEKGEIRYGSDEVVDDKNAALIRYMEYTGAVVKNRLDLLSFRKEIEGISMTGGAAVNDVWAQIIADVCGIEIHTIHFPELTAYGTALFAAEAAGIALKTKLTDLIVTKRFIPAKSDSYQRWYHDIQKDIME